MKSLKGLKRLLRLLLGLLDLSDIFVGKANIGLLINGELAALEEMKKVIDIKHGLRGLT